MYFSSLKLCVAVAASANLHISFLFVKKIQPRHHKINKYYCNHHRSRISIKVIRSKM